MHYDALIIGGGPSGASVAAVLAEYGHRVLVLERDKYPRYRIGESLIPFTYAPLERIGMIPKMRASGFQKKYSVLFVQPDGKASQPFYFFNRYDRDTVAQTWQVTRAEFDVLMLDNAREKGAEVREETTVKRLLMDGDRVIGVEAVDKDGGSEEIHAAITLDCTGRDAFAANKLGWRVPDPYLNKLAVWTTKAANARLALTKGKPPWPSFLTKAGSGTFRSTTIWSAWVWSQKESILRAGVLKTRRKCSSVKSERTSGSRTTSARVRAPDNTG